MIKNVGFVLTVLATIGMMIAGVGVCMIVMANAFVGWGWNIPALAIGAVVAVAGSYTYGFLMGD